MKQRLLSIFLSVTLALFAITAGIAAPILSRSFYAAHVTGLDLPALTGWTKQETLDAYDDVMDYLLRDGEFGTGVLSWSESGRAHFADVKVLFRLDLRLLILSAAALVLLLLLSRRTKPYRFAGRGPSFWAGAGVLAMCAVIVALGAADFDRAFTVFHSIFFPGKTNWLFDPSTDQIILILPEVFFRNCAVLAFGIICLLSLVYLWIGRKTRD